MQPPGLGLANAGDVVDRNQGSEASDRRSQRAKHAKLGAIVAIVGIERIADEAAVAGPTAKQADLALELNGCCREERNAEGDAAVADREPGRKIVAAVDHEVVTAKQRRCIPGIDPLLHRRCFDEAVEALHELQGEVGLRIAGVALAKERLALQVRFLDDVGIDDCQGTYAGRREGGDQCAADAAGADDGDARFLEPALSKNLTSSPAAA